MADYIKPPKWLSKVGREYWFRVASVLKEKGELNALTYDLLATGANAYASYRSATDTLASEGNILETKTTLKLHPAATVQKQAFEMLCRVFKELQLAGKPPTDQPSELETFLGESL